VVAEFAVDVRLPAGYMDTLSDGPGVLVIRCSVAVASAGVRDPASSPWLYKLTISF